MSVLKGLQPERVFYYFEEICKIPHGSGNTTKIAEFLVQFAIDHKLKYHRDESNNVIIYKAASPGYEQAPTVILQGHSDMVTEKDSDSTHDFERDGLSLMVEGDYLFAHQTTLGGDDGIAVAYALAVLENDELKHPALEAVITTDEEIGLLGATAFDAKHLNGKRLINIDSGEEGSLLVGCAGGLTTRSRIALNYVESTNTCIEVTIHGLAGGHSGTEIDKNRASAAALAGRFLFSLDEVLAYELAELQGGQKDNVITNEVNMLILIDGADETNLQDFTAKLQQQLRHEYAGSDEGITISLTNIGVDTQPVLHPRSYGKVLFFLMNMPFGVLKMSGKIDGLVETSANPGILKMTNLALEVGISVRSLVQSAKVAAAEKVQFLTEFLGGEYAIEGQYPAWEYNEDSQIKTVMEDVYQEQFGQAMEVSVIHAGLECGLFFDKIPGLDCVSFGPEQLDIHTTKEKLCISSVQRMWEYLIKVLERLN